MPYFLNILIFKNIIKVLLTMVNFSAQKWVQNFGQRLQQTFLHRRRKVKNIGGPRFRILGG